MVKDETKNACNNQGKKNRGSNYQADSSSETPYQEREDAKIETNCHAEGWV